MYDHFGRHEQSFDRALVTWLGVRLFLAPAIAAPLQRHDWHIVAMTERCYSMPQIFETITSNASVPAAELDCLAGFLCSEELWQPVVCVGPREECVDCEYSWPNDTKSTVTKDKRDRKNR